MDWFEEQLKKRRENDRRALDEAFEAANEAIFGSSFKFEEAEEELTLILRYYHLPNVRLSDKITDDDDKLRSVCRVSGLMNRPVQLEKGWYKNAFGAFLCKFKKTGKYVAVVPSKLGGFTYFDKEKRRRVRVNHKTAQLLCDEAICFYKPLPNTKLSVWSLIKLALSSWSVSDYIFTFIILIVVTLLGLMTPKLTNFLYDTVIKEASITLLVSTLTFIVTISLSITLLNVVKSMFTNRAGVKMNAALNSASMMRILSLPTSFFQKYSSGEILNRMGFMRSITTDIITMVFSTSLSCLFSLSYFSSIFTYSPSLVVPSLIVILLDVVYAILVAIRQVKYSKRMMELSAHLSGVGIEMITNVQKIKTTGSEKRMFARYTKGFAKQTRISYNPPFFNKYSGVVSAIIGYIGVLIIYASAIRNKISVSDYYAFNTAYAAISSSITTLVSVGIKFAELKPSVDMIEPILNAVPEYNANAEEVISLDGNIEINNISFKYDENSPRIFKDFSLKINAGEYLAIVGKTGCGKSTLVKLLLGFEKPQNGSIYYDGRDLEMLEKRSLRQKIGTVLQDDRLFLGDIYSNIIISAPTLSLERAWEAAEVAGIADDIRAMPMGMHTIISEGSGGISGGQRQRLAIARAIAPKPKILIFDEATSALDNITQKNISEALDKFDCTRIVIAHRLSTIRHCDRIVVMDKGQIIEDGTYEQLIAKKGEFYELVERQRVDE